MFSQLYQEPGVLGFEAQILGSTVTGANSGRSLCLVSDTRATLAPTADQMARWFAADGWRVTLLDLSPYRPPFPSPATYEYRMLGGNFQETDWQAPMQSLCAYHWLKAQKFDLIAFQHGFGAAYFPCAARRMHLAFENTPMIVIPDTPYAYWLETAERLITNVRLESEIDYLEREAAARADGVLFTNPKALEWMVNARWELGADADRIAILGEDGKGKAWGEWMAEKAARPALTLAIPAEEISISVVVSSYNRPDHLRETIRSLLGQTHKIFEVIVVNTLDAGIEDPHAEFRDIFEQRKWKWVRQPRLGLPAAHSHGASLASGTHLLFMDDDNLALPDEVEIFARAARSGADIYMCPTGKHYLSDNSLAYLARFPARPGSGVAHQDIEWIHFGPVIANGIFYNTFGDTNSLIRKDVFDKLGGFGTHKLNSPDWTGYGRAGLAGYKFESIPEALLLYRVHAEGWSRRDKFQTLMRIMSRTYAPQIPAFLYPLLLQCMQADKKSKTHPGRFPDPDSCPEVETLIKPHKVFAAPARAPVIEVVTAVTDQYLRPACAMIASLFANSTKPIRLHVISDMSAANNEALVAAAERFGAAPHIIPYRADDNRLPPSGLLNNTPEGLFWHIMLPEYVPSIDRAIALDCDCFIRDDIAPLWNLDLGGAPLAAAIDRGVAGSAHLKKWFQGHYFHAGVMLADLALWRKQGITETALANLRKMEVEKNVGHLWGSPALNMAVGARWMKLSPRWNWVDNVSNMKYPRSADLATLGVDQKEYQSIAANPYICRTEDQQLPEPWMTDGIYKGLHGNEIKIYLKLVNSALAAIAAKQAAA